MFRLTKPLVLLAVVATLSAQGDEKIPAQDHEKSKVDLQAARVALNEWLRERGGDEKKLFSAVKKLMALGKPGLVLVAEAMKDAEASGDEKRLIAVDKVIAKIGLAFMDAVDASKMIFAGQYNDLRVLMPRVGELFTGLLLATPQWYSLTLRWRTVPALRDLYPNGPETKLIDQMKALAKNLEEPEYLRVRVSYALAQWGDRELIKAKIRALEKTSRSKDEESALLALRDLAEIYYGIRDYAVAAVTHRESLARAVAIDYSIVPVQYYNAACCMSLSGDRRSALEYMKRCLELNRSTRIDPSMRLERKLFENDPEIALVRKAKGFAEMLREAFPEKGGVVKRSDSRRTRK